MDLDILDILAGRIFINMDISAVRAMNARIGSMGDQFVSKDTHPDYYEGILTVTWSDDVESALAYMNVAGKMDRFSSFLFKRKGLVFANTITFPGNVIVGRKNFVPIMDYIANRDPIAWYDKWVDSFSISSNPLPSNIDTYYD